MSDNKNFKTVYIDESNDSKLVVRELFERYSRYWKFFLLSLAVSFCVAFIYLYFTPKRYQVSTSILVDDENENGYTSELSVFKDLELLSGSNTTIITEMGILKSRALIARVVKELGIHISYSKREKFKDIELYRAKAPFRVTILDDGRLVDKLDTTLIVTGLTEEQFSIKNSNGDLVVSGNLGESLKCDFGDILVTPNNVNIPYIGEEIKVTIEPVNSKANYYRDKIRIAPESKNSNLLIITLFDKNINKATDILNQLVKQYNLDAISTKSQIAENTEEFINRRLDIISENLSSVDKEIESFKIENNLTDISKEIGLNLNVQSEIESNILKLNTQIKLTDYLIDYIKDNPDRLLPSKMGLEGNSVNQNISNYNMLVLEKNRMKDIAGTANPVIANLNQQIVGLKSIIVQSLMDLKSANTFSLEELKGQESKLTSKISDSPIQERKIKEIQRQQQIIETLYLYLLQKREENSISLAAIQPNSKMIDSADGSSIPIYPVKPIVYLIAFLSGIGIPFIYITLHSLLNNKVQSVEDIEGLIQAPIIGSIPMVKNMKNVLITEDDQFILTESLRTLRTNVNFMLTGNQNESNVIFVTSTIANEGKTFIAINLAASLSLLKKKVLLIGADIRKPKIAHYLKVSSKKGLTHYLMNSESEVYELIISNDDLTFDIIDSSIPAPNPTELLMNNRFDKLIAFSREHYDFIVVDTAPVGNITDTLLISKNADLFLYVVRENFVDKRLLKIPNDLYNNQRLPNLSILLNATNKLNARYSYGGYNE